MLHVLLLLVFSSGNLLAVIQDTLFDYRMAIAFGKPLKTNGSKTSKQSFDDCVQTCWAELSCVFVYETTTGCEMYKVAQVSTVQKLTSGKRVAFRVKTTLCSAVSPLQNGVVMQGDADELLDTYRTYTTYNITLSSNVWTFNSSNPLICSNPFLFTRRTKGLWCIGIFKSGSCNTQGTAADLCATYTPNGRLSGFADAAEFEYFRDTAVRYVPASIGTYSYSVVGFWVDGIRKSNCKYPAAKSATCNGTNEFAYSDSMMSAPGGYEFMTGQPDGIANSSANSNCLFLRAKKISLGSAIDDSPCSEVQTAQMCMMGYVCGRQTVSAA